MSAENSTNKCRDCKFGRVSQVRSFNLPFSPFPSAIIIAPKVERTCLSRLEVLKDSVASAIENKTGHKFKIPRVERRTYFAATCVKPESYSPKEK